MSPAVDPDDARREVRAVTGPAPVHGTPAAWLPEYLHRLDETWGGVQPAHLEALAQELQLPPEQVRAVAGRCAQITLLAPGEAAPALRLTVCEGLPCALAGAEALRAQLPPLLPAGVALTASSCLGRCQHAPAVLVGQVPVAPATPEGVLNTLLEEATRAPGEMGQAHGAPDAESYEAYRAGGGYVLAADLAQGQRDAAGVLRLLDEAQLAGRAGLVAAQWRALRAQPAPRHLVVDLAGGEPGDFAARQALEREPHRFLEGVLVAALLAGAEAVVIELHPAWHDARLLLQAQLAHLRAGGLFLQPVVELRRGASAWPGGEAAARLDFAPLFALRELVERGPAWFRAQGRRQRHGVRRFSVSGRVRSPGVKLAPAGISLCELVEEHCDGMAAGHALYAWLPGGASGGILPAQLADEPLDGEALQAHGAAPGPAAIVVLGAQDSARAAALACLRHFAAHGCAPDAACAESIARAHEALASPQCDAALLQQVRQELAGHAGCAQAAAAARALHCIERHFPAELRR